MKIVFMGTPDAAVSSLQRLIDDSHEIAAVYTQPDRPAGRGNKMAALPVKEFAQSKGLKVLQPLKIRTHEAIDTFRSHRADAAIVVAYGRILPSEYLEAFQNGAINVHFSLLPKYRGAAPVNWAIVNGETETGVTTMRMDAGLDTGDMLLQRRVHIDGEETSIELMLRLSLVGADLISETLRDLSIIKPVPQDHSLATFAPILKKEDGLIDWTSSSRDICRRVKGFQPFPGTFTYLADEKLTLWQAGPVAIETSPELRAGEIADAHGDRLVVACGRGTFLGIEQLQLAGKRRMTSREFLNGSRLKKGDILGSK